MHRHRPHDPPPADTDSPVDRIVGLGEHSMRKSYYPELRRRLRELECFRTLLDAGNDLVLLVALPRGGVVDANLPLCRRLGWPRDELLGRPLAELVPDGVLDVLLAGGAESGHFDTFLVARSGEAFPVDLTCRVSGADTPGEERMALIVARDITERRHFESQLQAEKQRAERANRAKSKFLAAASHDLRQPAQSLSLFVALLARQLEGHPAAAALGPLEASVDALRLLLDGLLDVSRLDAGLVVPAPRPIAVESVLAPLRAEYLLRAADGEVRLAILPSRHWVVSDPALLTTMLRHLIDNAIRYTPRGRIIVGCRRRGYQVEIQVQDSGIGLAPEELDNVFEEFYQVGNSARDRGQGLGLGLAIVRRLAELLGHPVRVRSVPGKGSCFGLALRRSPAVGPSGGA